MNVPTGGRGVRVAAHAKLNLLLRILAREAGGHHGLETLFIRLALADDVVVRVFDDARDAAASGRAAAGDAYVEESPDGACVLSLNGPALPPSGLGVATSNLAWRAAETYLRAAGWPAAWHIHVTKRIPVGGGLGGGSSNAAAVLRALDALNPSPLGLAQLLVLGGRLGADVPFLLQPAPFALGWSRGDRLLPLTPLPPRPVALVVFDEGVSTADAYAAVAAARQSAGGAVPLAAVYDAGAFADWHAIAALAANDFEAVVPQMHAGVAAWLPPLEAIARSLQAQGVAAIGRLSGSGATCFLVGDDAHDPLAALAPVASAHADGPLAGEFARARLVRTETLAVPVDPVAEPV